MPDNQKIIIKIDQICKTFQVGSQQVKVIKNISLEVNSGDFVIIFGPSGCGKSTLLHMLLGLEQPTQGKVMMLGKDVYDNTLEDDRAEFRKTNIGMVYQQPNWIKALTVIENVAFPLLLQGKEKRATLAQALSLLEQIGLADWQHYAPTELSSGQQQRIALARALVHDPNIIVADEPTGNLDYESGRTIMKLLEELNKKFKKTIIMVTHDLEFLPFAKNVVKMHDGQIAVKYSQKQTKKLIQSLKNKYKLLN